MGKRRKHTNFTPRKSTLSFVVAEPVTGRMKKERSAWATKRKNRMRRRSKGSRVLQGMADTGTSIDSRQEVKQEKKEAGGEQKKTKGPQEGKSGNHVVMEPVPKDSSANTLQGGTGG